MDHFELVSEYALHRRPAAGYKRSGRRLQKGQPIPDITWGHGFRQNIHDGEYHTGAE